MNKPPRPSSPASQNEETRKPNNRSALDRALQCIHSLIRSPKNEREKLGYFSRKEFAAVYDNQGADYALQLLLNQGYIQVVDHDTMGREFGEYHLNLKWYVLTEEGRRRLEEVSKKE